MFKRSGQSGSLAQLSVELLPCKNRKLFLWTCPFSTLSSSSSYTRQTAARCHLCPLALRPLTSSLPIIVGLWDSATGPRLFCACWHRLVPHVIFLNLLFHLLFLQLHDGAACPTGSTAGPPQTAAGQAQCVSLRVVRTTTTIQRRVFHSHQGRTDPRRPHLHIWHLHHSVLLSGGDGSALQTRHLLPVGLDAQRRGQAVLHRSRGEQLLLHQPVTWGMARQERQR